MSNEELKPCRWCGAVPETSAVPNKPVSAVRCATRSCPVRSHGWMSPNLWGYDEPVKINGHNVPERVWIDFRDEPANRYWRVYTAPNAFATTGYTRTPTDAEELERLRSLKSKIAWHRDGIGPDVPVLQERYDKLIAARATDAERLVRLEQALRPIISCYGLGLSPEKFTEQVGPFILDARAALAEKR